MSSAEADAPGGGRKSVKLVIAGLMIVTLIGSLEQTIVATALPTIVGDLGGLEHLSWVVTSYLLALTVATPLYGKLGDQYGRKPVLQSALVIFLVGSVLCGLAQSMTQLIAFRVIQGIGGGGLMVTAQAAIGDVVAPRDRGRYAGIIGGVYALSSVAGPLIGGSLTTHLSWRWIFYVNLPVGVLALVALAITMPAARNRVSHRIDYLGALLLAISLSSIVLITTLGGNELAWGSAEIAGLGAAALIGTVLFVLAERRAAEPILPPALARNRAFVLTAGIAFVIGFALFAAVTYVPLFGQIVRGQSPTESGLQLMPIVLGMFVTSVIVGRIVSNTGRYKASPIVGTALTVVGLLLLSRLGKGTGTLEGGAYLFVLGSGFGLVMPVIIVAVQSAVPYSELGVATSGVTTFRSIGGALGTAALGAIFAGRIASELEDRLPPGESSLFSSGARTEPSAVQRLPEQLHDIYVAAFTSAIGVTFLVAAAAALIGLLLALLIEERPLRQTVESQPLEDTFPVPRGADALSELTRMLSRAVGRERARRFMARAAAKAAVDLPDDEIWILARGARGHSIDSARLSAEDGRAPATFDAIKDSLRARALLDGDQVTPAGAQLDARLQEARVEVLREIVLDWDPARNPEIDGLIRRVGDELGVQPPDRPRPSRAA